MRRQLLKASGSSCFSTKCDSFTPSQTCLTTLARAQTRVSNSVPRSTERSLYAKVQSLLRLNQPEAASASYHQHIFHKIRIKFKNVSPCEPSSRHSNDHEYLLRTAQLFRSYGHPQLAVKALIELQDCLNSVDESTQSSNSSLLTKAAVLFMQSCNEAAWNFDHSNQEASTSKTVCHHTELGRLLGRLESAKDLKPRNLGSLAHKVGKQSLRKGQQTTKIEIQTAEESKVLEVILGTLLKLGEPDWLISILKQAFPRFIFELGPRLYSTSTHQTFDIPWTKDEIPSGRIVKFLVASYTLAGDLDRAYIIWRFYRQLWIRNLGDQPRDPAPDITLLRAISRSSHTSRKHLRIITNILDGLHVDSIPLDTYVLEGLMDLRYRLRSQWAARRPHEAAFEALQSLLCKSIGLFLLHWRRPLSSNVLPVCVNHDLITGANQGQRQLMAWRFRPTARSFTLCLLSLRSNLKYQARSAIRKQSSISKNTYHVDRIVACPKRRPSPGPHRALLCQLIILERLYASSLTRSEFDSASALPSRFRLLTPVNLKLSFDVCLDAKDYAGACVLLRIMPAPSSNVSRDLFDVIIKEVPYTVKRALRLPSNYDAFLDHLLSLQWPLESSADVEPSPSTPIPISSSGDVVKRQMYDGGPKTSQALEVLLRCCESDRSDSWWEAEIAAVYRRLNREHIRIEQIINQTALSEFTLDPLRKYVAKSQYDLLCQGLPT